jgi:DNA-binding response OmpR family regulator
MAVQVCHARQVRTNSQLQTPVVALFNASDDTVEMVQRMLDASGVHCLVNCRFADLRKGVVDFGGYLRLHKPDVVIFDISPPYEQNWEFFRTLRDDREMSGRGLVLTTTNKDRLDEVVGEDSRAIEVVGKPYDVDQIMTAITGALVKRRGPTFSEPRPAEA